MILGRDINSELSYIGDSRGFSVGISDYIASIGVISLCPPPRIYATGYVYFEYEVFMNLSRSLHVPKYFLYFLTKHFID